ncbi:MAG: DUF971 domain-containing protein [Anaerolinea sp.]|nr:DUF971 domain-containing protein [Anaerolinea sp.]
MGTAMSGNLSAVPANIVVNKAEGWLRITWADGTTCTYPLAHLREACPCVQCRGGHAFMGPAHDPQNLLTLTPKRSYGLLTIERVGNYAIQPVWDDGHSTGIYTWEFLRKLCPQDDDRPASTNAAASERHDDGV